MKMLILQALKREMKSPVRTNRHRIPLTKDNKANTGSADTNNISKNGIENQY